MNDKNLHTIFAAMQTPRLGQFIARIAPKLPTTEQAAKLAKRREQEAEAIERSRAIIAACPPAGPTRQVCRRADFFGVFSAVSQDHADIPRSIRRSIARDILKRDRAVAKKAA